MLLEKTRQVRSAIDHGLYYPALALALTIPDICAKVEFGSSNGDINRHKHETRVGLYDTTISVEELKG